MGVKLGVSAYGKNIRGCIQKFPDLVDNEMNNNKHSLRSKTKDYGDKTTYTDSQNSDITAPCGRELYYLRFSRQAWPVRKLLDTPSYMMH